MANLSTTFLDIPFKNPLVGASGTFGFGQEYHEIFDVGQLGGISSKGLTINPKTGNEGIRIWETPMGMMNSIGLQNPGVRAFISQEIPRMQSYGTNIIANLGGNTLDEYLQGVDLLNNTGIQILELNISCPNVKAGGMAFGIKANIAYETVKKVKEICHKPLMVKLSPNAEDIVEMAQACESAGADALSLINTLSGMAVDIYRRQPVFNNVYAGLSGPAIKPIAMRMVHQVSKAVKIPVCGMGGISHWEDVIAFMMAGSQIVQVGTANFVKPDIMLDMLQGIDNFLEQEGIKNIQEIVGVL